MAQSDRDWRIDFMIDDPYIYHTWNEEAIFDLEWRAWQELGYIRDDLAWCRYDWDSKPPMLVRKSDIIGGRLYIDETHPLYTLYEQIKASR